MSGESISSTIRRFVGSREPKSNAKRKKRLVHDMSFNLKLLGGGTSAAALYIAYYVAFFGLPPN